MRKMFFLAALLLTSVCAQAQQAIFERHDTRSPEFNADGTVTLRIKAPQAKEVVVIGDCIEKGRQVMTNQDGLWSYTTSVLPAVPPETAGRIRARARVSAARICSGISRFLISF